MPKRDLEVITIDRPPLKPDQVAHINEIRKRERRGAAALVEVLGGVARRQMEQARKKRTAEARRRRS